jgi:hypothetical protein
MPQNLLSQKNSIIGVVILVVVLGSLYGAYTFVQGLSSDQSTASVDPSLLSKDLKAFYDVKDKISLQEKDLAFTKKPFYTQLKDNTVEIPSIAPTGRPNPFWAP